MIIKLYLPITQMNAKQQLAFNLNTIICCYLTNKNITRFYNKLLNLNCSIYNHTSKDLYDDYKYDMRYIYNNIINGDEDITIINDFIFILQKIQLGLLIFE